MKSSCLEPVFALPNDQVALFLRHLWATDGSVRWDATVGGARIYYASTSRRLVDDLTQLLLRLGVFSRISALREAWIPRLLAPLYRYGRRTRPASLIASGCMARGGSRRERSLPNSALVSVVQGADTIPKGVWSQIGAALSAKGVTHCELSAAMNSQFASPTRALRSRSTTVAPSRRATRRS